MLDYTVGGSNAGEVAKAAPVVGVTVTAREFFFPGVINGEASGKALCRYMWIGDRKMSDWRLHWLEAEGDLQCWRSQVECEIGAARMAITGLISAPRLDILVQRIAGAVIPEIGIGGHTYRKSLFALTLDPDNQHFAASLAEGALRRMVAHEVHHCLRMAGPGYGRTLGEALVSEGLAGRFVARLFGNAPEPWERAVDENILSTNRPDAASLASTSFKSPRRGT
jgi:hypothetical protein